MISPMVDLLVNVLYTLVAWPVLQSCPIDSSMRVQMSVTQPLGAAKKYSGMTSDVLEEAHSSLHLPQLVAVV